MALNGRFPIRRIGAPDPEETYAQCISTGGLATENLPFEIPGWWSIRHRHESNALRSCCRPFATDANGLLGGERFVSQSAACAAFLIQEVSTLPA